MSLYCACVFYLVILSIEIKIFKLRILYNFFIHSTLIDLQPKYIPHFQIAAFLGHTTMSLNICSTDICHTSKCLTKCHYFHCLLPKS